MLFFVPFFGGAQPGVSPVVEYDGKQYYEHLVEAGNTLWGLQRMYGVPVATIVDENPALQEGLKVGQKVRIPFDGKVETSVATQKHKVKSGETLYGISRKYETTVDVLISLNPELEGTNLQKGQCIQVPHSDNPEAATPPAITTPNPFSSDTIEKPDGSVEWFEFTFSDSTVRHIVMKHETMYGISRRFMISVEEIMKVNGLSSDSVKEGQVLIIPLKQERAERVEVRSVPSSYDSNGSGPVEFEPKDEYKIAMLIPFHLDAGPQYSKYVSELATQFYMGACMALDSLERKGLKADIHIFDTRNDSARVVSLINDTSFLSMDLIIGPFFESNVKIVAEFCKANRIRMVCPTAMPDEVPEGNRLVFAAVPSNERLFRLLARHMVQNNSKDQIVLVKPKLESEMPLYQAFKKAYEAAAREAVTAAPLKESTMSEFTGHVRRGIQNRFVMPTNDRRTALDFMNRMNKHAGRSSTLPISVYGTKSWMNFSEINAMYLDRYNFRYASSNFADYYSDPMIHLNKQHRTRYKTDLSKMAVHGYDVMMHFCSDFFLKKKSCLMMSKFDMKQLDEKSGYVNKSLYVLEVDEYELFNSEIPRD